MKERRKLNKELFREWLSKNEPQAAGEPSARDKLIQECDYAFSRYMIDKILCQGQAPKLNNRMRIVKATGLRMDDLFPMVKRKGA